MAIHVKIPSLGESVTEAVLGTWLAKEGDAVAVDEAIFELESDKANMEIAAEAAGTLKILKAEGELVCEGDVVAEIDPAGAAKAAPATKSAPSQTAVTPDNAAPASSDGAEPFLSPAVRRIVEEKDLDAKNLPASGPGGRITKADALAAADTPTPAALPPAAAVSRGDRGERRVRMSRMRQLIARRLVDVQRTAAILTTFNEVDLSAVMELRNHHKETFREKHGVGLGFMSFFSKACCSAAQVVPELNAEIQGDEILYRDAVHMGVAVGTPKGLIVPVVKNCDLLSFAGIEQEIARLAAKGRDGKLAIDDLSGATFTISNGGVYGSMLSTPILNPPQAGILGMHKIEKRPVVVDDEIVIRPMMYLALSYDHRIVDGEGAVTFLVNVKQELEDPARLLLEV
ncbi:MAG: 2-oxoglutarate dehydrogenase complex dihydrolipoyllysine-residue succinyltransferase [bacterium]